jgi:type IV secretion system protein TrbE
VRARTVLTTLQDNGFTARLEAVNAMDAFFGTLPGHGTPNLRRPLLSSANVAALWPVTSVWPGLAHNPSQYFPRESPPLVHVATDGSTPFRLNLHVGDVGHSLLVGATGGGKSTFVGLLIAQWQRYPHARTFIFDVGYSHWLLGKAAGAQHYDIGGSADGASAAQGAEADSVSLQPLADVDRPEERAWAAEWLEMLLELQGVTITPPRRLRIDRALVLVGEQPREFRTLTELMVQLQDSALVDALRPYTAGGAFGRLLDGHRDAVGVGRYQIFELKHLMDMGDKILVPVLLHLFRRVERQLDGSPGLIVIEELWAALLRTVFTSRIQQWLVTLRKQNAAVMLVAHSLAQLEQVPAKQVVIESCPTKVLLPNADAANSSNARLYHDLGLNDREIAIISSATPKRDYYVKSPLGSRLVTLDLGPVALAFIGTPDGSTIDAVMSQVEGLVADAGERWASVWLEQLGIRVPTHANTHGDENDREVPRSSASRSVESHSGEEVPSYAHPEA